MNKYNLALMNENEVNSLLLEKINECRDLINSFIFKHQKYDRGDVENCCYEGVYKAIINYDEEKNNSFKAYARLWIQSELAYFRASELPIPENKETHRKRAKVLRYINDTNTFNPTDNDSSELNVTISEFNTYKFSYRVLSLDKPLSDDGYTLGDGIPSNDNKKLHLFDYVKKLANNGLISSEELELIEDIYFNRRTEAEISKELKVRRQAVNKRKQAILKRLNSIFVSEFGSLNEARINLTY